MGGLAQRALAEGGVESNPAPRGRKIEFPAAQLPQKLGYLVLLHLSPMLLLNRLHLVFNTQLQLLKPYFF